jgi:hypothetical protein
MTDDGVLLDRSAIEDAFRRLGDRLERRGVVADLYIFGGAAMAMVYDSRRATRDMTLSSSRTVSYSKRRMQWQRNWACLSGG